MTNPLIQMKRNLEIISENDAAYERPFKLAREALTALESSDWNLEAIPELIEAAELSLARGEDHADSYITKPLREALSKLKSGQKS